MRRSRLWPLKVVLDALRVRAAQYKTRPSQAEHVAGRAGPAGARGASQLLGNRRVPGAGTLAHEINRCLMLVYALPFFRPRHRFNRARNSQLATTCLPPLPPASMRFAHTTT
jgi:hypothetical protein